MFKSINLTRIAAALVASYALVLMFSLGRDGGFLINAAGHPLPIEFVGMRAAGEMVLEGQPAAAYDWAVHKARQNAITQQTTGDYYPWGYPPPFLAMAALFAVLPYLAAVTLWLGATLALQVWTTVSITGTSRAALWVLAAPVTFVNTSVAHTGFLLAALLGFGLAALARAPVAAGVALGLLAFKPQFAILVPVALAAGGYWRTLTAAAVTVAFLCAASLVVFGVAPWQEFPDQLARIADIFRFGRVETAAVVSFYGLGRALGLGHAVALLLQAMISLVAAVAVAVLWRSSAELALKAAGLVVACLLASPYVFVYDLTALVAAMAFLFRAAAPDGFDETELCGVAAAGGLVFMWSIVSLPIGLLATVLVALLVVRRCRQETARVGGPGMSSGVRLAHAPLQR